MEQALSLPSFNKFFPVILDMQTKFHGVEGKILLSHPHGRENYLTVPYQSDQECREILKALTTSDRRRAPVRKDNKFQNH